MCGVKDVYRQTKKISDLREKMEKYLKYLKERKRSFLTLNDREGFFSLGG